MQNKKVYIEKYDIESFKKEHKPYFMIRTEVIQKASPDLYAAIMIWIYLQTLPVSWIPNKHHLMKHFGISPRTYERRMALLSSCGLIQYRQERYTDGSFGPLELIVLNGETFDPACAYPRTVTIGGTVIDRSLKDQIEQPDRSANFGDTDSSATTHAQSGLEGDSPFRQKAVVRLNDAHINNINNTTKEKEVNTTTAKPQNPVVVNTDSSKPKPTPDVLSPYEVKRLTDAYNKKQVTTEFITSLELFLQAALFSILNRDDHITRQQRVAGIVKLVGNGFFEEPAVWRKEQKSLRDSRKGDAQKRLVEEQMNQRAQKELNLKPTPTGIHSTGDLLKSLTGKDNYRQFVQDEKEKHKELKKSLEQDLERPRPTFKKIHLPDEMRGEAANAYEGRMQAQA